MRFIQEELDRIRKEMAVPLSDGTYCQLYAAQQALSWALDREGYAAPSVTILNGKVQPLTPGTLAS